MNTTCNISLKQHTRLWGQDSLMVAAASVYPTSIRGSFNPALELGAGG